MAFETLDPENQTAADTKEHFQMGEDVPDDHPDAKLPLHGPNQWPAEVPSPRKTSGHRLSALLHASSNAVEGTHGIWLQNQDYTDGK